jgi:hypothetical protein
MPANPLLVLTHFLKNLEIKNAKILFQKKLIYINKPKKVEMTQVQGRRNTCVPSQVFLKKRRKNYSSKKGENFLFSRK